MMRLWVQSYARQSSIAPVVTLSVGFHAAIIAAWVVATRPAANVPAESIANRSYYIPPPDKVPGGGGGPREVVHYVDLGDRGLGLGDGPRAMGNVRPVTADVTSGAGRRDTTASETPAAPPSPPGQQDSVFTIVEVDTAVVRAANSAAPAYPLKLLQAHIVGYVAARYVVDTTGFADTTSFTVLSATNPEFVTSVREALPYMRFQPAKIGPLKVRQLVEQKFSFTINDTGTVAPRLKRP